MIVDLHTRVWESADQLGNAIGEQMRRRWAEPWRRPVAAPQAHHEAMRPAANAMILGLESRMLGAAITHEQVAGYIAQAPGKCLGLAGIDPTASSPTRSLERALDLGLSGVTMCPAAAGFHPIDTRAMAVYEACADRGLPVLIESGTLLARECHMEFARPHLLDEAARSFPDLKLILGSFADPWIDEALAMLAKHPTVFADLSGLLTRPWQLFNALVLAHQRGVIHQVLFGSGFPICHPEKAIMTIYAVNTMSQGTTLPTVPREQLRSIIERDALTVLGIEAPRPEPRAQPAAPEADGAERDHAEGSDGSGDSGDSGDSGESAGDDSLPPPAPADAAPTPAKENSGG